MRYWIVCFNYTEGEYWANQMDIYPRLPTVHFILTDTNTMNLNGFRIMPEDHVYWVGRFAEGRSWPQIHAILKRMECTISLPEPNENSMPTVIVNILNKMKGSLSRRKH